VIIFFGWPYSSPFTLFWFLYFDIKTQRAKLGILFLLFELELIKPSKVSQEERELKRESV